MITLYSVATMSLVLIALFAAVVSISAKANKLGSSIEG